ncbi:GW domain-containing glycosaminoglycan-binding protein [Listeria grayi]|uniref:GW domain-containing glycosaminoglycan-binding protein n=1 Tax=Listeria grayi TaxID=1641 RepID=UPI001623B992|nr:GW domain-containing glycosaminoglycan-binding protein [Listeria grayi]MBC1921011.1 GW domain-containing glycosaminoglycan-binding protein [Listeria grayi]
MKKNLVNTVIVTCLSLGLTIAPFQSVFAADSSEDAIQHVKEGTVFSLEENRQAAMDMMEQDQSIQSNRAAQARVATFAAPVQSKQEKFFASISGYAQKLSQKYNVYASVMMAQSALESAWGESGLSKKANNFFGVKGKYKGQSVIVETREFSNGKWITIKAEFRKYPSFYESMEDNASKLRNGVSWDHNYYKGTWYENTKSYKDSTKWLTGRYATDPDYNKKLDSIIEKYGLTKYDKYDTILYNKAVNYKRTILNSKTYYFYSDIYHTNPKVKKLENAGNYANKEVQVVREAKTDRATWLQVKYGTRILGWVNKNAGTIYDPITSQKNVQVNAQSKKGYPIYNKIYGTASGVKQVAKSDTYVKNELQVSKEAVTKRGTWAEVKKSGKVLGWVDKKALTYFDAVTSNKAVSSLGMIKPGVNVSIYNQIYGTTANTASVAESKKYTNRDLKIIREATTKRGNWAQIQEGSKTLGWISKGSLTYLDKITSKKTLKVNAKVKAQKNDSVYTQVYNTTSQAKKAANLSSYNGKEVQVVSEAITKSGTWSQIKSGSKTLGWVSKARLAYYEPVAYNKTVSKDGGVKARSQDRIYSDVYKTTGKAKDLGKLSAYNNKNIKIIREAKGKTTVWYQFKVGNKVIGWANKAGFQTYDKLIYNKKVNRTGKVVNTSKYYFYNKIYGTALNTKKMNNAKKYANKKVTVIREAKTSRSTWVQIKYGNKLLGWVNKKAIK